MRTMPETAAITAHITSPSCAIWPLISCPRNPPRVPCVSKSNGPVGRTLTSQSSSPKSEMRLPCGQRPLDLAALRLEELRELRRRQVEVDPAALLRQILPFVARRHLGHQRVEFLTLGILDAALGENAPPVDEFQVDALLLQRRRIDTLQALRR